MTTEQYMARRVLICGDRYWGGRIGPDDKIIYPEDTPERRMIYLVLDGLWAEHDSRFAPMVVIDGHAPGADQIAHDWYDQHPLGKVPTPAADERLLLMCFPANWSKYGKAAGPVRNQQMLNEGQPNLVIGFHNDIASSTGTADMLKRSKAQGLEVWTFGMYDQPASKEPLFEQHSLF